MRKTQLDPRILKRLKEKTKGEISEKTIRPELSIIRRDNPSLTLNAAAEVFAKKRGLSVSRYLGEKDRASLKTVEVERTKIRPLRAKPTQTITKVAQYETDDKLLLGHLNEINRTYTYRCYTATFILCRKVLENLLVHNILRRKYSKKTKQHREKYFDFNRNRNLDFEKLLSNLRNSASDFVPDNQLVERICSLADGFKETANEMTHSLYHIATKKEIDDKNFQNILDLVGTLEKNLVTEVAGS